ncbi:unnamed protein product [Arctogadus glacialis]
MMKGAPVSPTPLLGGGARIPGQPCDHAYRPQARRDRREAAPPRTREKRPALQTRGPGEAPPRPPALTRSARREDPKDPPPRRAASPSASPPPGRPTPGPSPGLGPGSPPPGPGEVVFTSKMSSGQEEEGRCPSSPFPQTYTFQEPITDGEDDGENIMAELQVFQKCPVGGALVEPQVKELRAGALPALKEKTKTSDPAKEKEDKSPDTDENGNTQSRQSPAVIYYVTGQITKEHPPSTTPEEPTERSRESTFPPSQSLVSPTSRMPVPLSTKARQSPGITEKPAKQPKLPDAQRQFRQGNGSAKRADHKAPSPSVSKIPAFYPSATKGTSAPNPDATNTNNPSSSSSSSSSSSNNKSSLPSPHHPPRSSSSSSSPSSSHLPSLSNGNPKLTPATPSQHAGKTLSLSSPQTQNIRVHSYSSSSSSYSSSSSSSPSPLSPTPLGPGGRSIRTIHTPSFTSYRSHNGSKSCIPTATKDSN